LQVYFSSLGGVGNCGDHDRFDSSEFAVSVMMNHPNERRRLILTIGTLLNLGLLFWFKYFNFLFDNVNNFLELTWADKLHLDKIHVPIGISFFTFQEISPISNPL
jgi:D-alanyl-lipoteichoic acid acyltransferase DltB (MBOAT superfamily)